ncbi:MAG: sarcosine oxidase subunit delta [Gammaproteobacteria bacterium]|nr:MAG: sarcosine oxidase subunit delta [Gammaproteobacteria bacterium]
MLQIKCPWCGERDEHEFSYGGEAHITRPKNPDKLSDEQWADYLFMQQNTMGLFLERWVHAHGCRRWFNVRRDTVTHEITAVYKMGARPPEGAA